MNVAAIERAKLALEGLSVADAFGEQLLHAGPHTRALMLNERAAPVGRKWMWTDDTIMSVSIVECLAVHGGVDIDELARRFAHRYIADPGRGYGGTAHGILASIGAGEPYAMAAGRVFDGQGSMGNGGGMRSAPIGAYFCDDLDAVVEHARRSAAPTHAHPEGVAGAIAVAVAAARVFAGERDARALLEAVVERTPAGETRSRLARAIPMLGAEPLTVATELGNGAQVISADTIPFAVWCAATHLADYAGALWACGDVGGDIDTTCAISGGIVVGAVGLAGIPAEWRNSREPLPA
ncbi:MAG: ADP-ribosylglycohydrolase family protein [Kofleriaceae bacterium]